MFRCSDANKTMVPVLGRTTVHVDKGIPWISNVEQVKEEEGGENSKAALW